MSQKTNLTDEQVKTFVAAAHKDLDEVKQLYAETPELLNARYQEWNETAVEAAAHMGRQDIARFLLDKGAPLNICAAAMLGDTDAVEAFLRQDPSLVNATGAHGIPLLTHAAIGGGTDVADLLWGHGNNQDLDGALHGAVAFGRKEMVKWLLAKGANPKANNHQEKTAWQVAVERGHDEIADILRQYVRARRG